MNATPPDAIYQRRFSDSDELQKRAVWQEITGYLQRFIPQDSAVLDIACDRGHFIDSIVARERWATDARDVQTYLSGDIRFVQSDGLALAKRLPAEYFDAVFMSNYLEHLPSSDAVIEQLNVARELLRPGGRAIVLQPNIRLVGNRYWDFIDHHVALTERSLIEALELAGLAVEHRVTRFLPYTTKSRLPQGRRFVRAYLALPPIWRFFGKQTLVVAQRL